MKTELTNPLLSLRQVAEQISMSIDCVRTRVRNGELAYYLIGGRIRIRQRDLEDFLAQSYVSSQGRTQSRNARAAKDRTPS